MMHGWGFTAARQGIPQRFEEQYHCYSVAYADKPHLEVSVRVRVCVRVRVGTKMLNSFRDCYSFA
jgi:hypothetical protein